MSRNRFEKNKSDIRKIDNGGAVRKRSKKHRRSSIGRMALVMTVLAVAAVGTVLSLTVFFKIKAIDVYGETRYSSKEIISAGNIALESNLIRLDSGMVSQRIERELPYIEKAEVKKRLPTTVELNVTPAKAAGYIKTESGYSIISTNGKVLEKTTELPSKMAQISGIDVADVDVAGRVSDEQGALKSISIIYETLGKGMSANITALHVGDRINLSFVYRDRVTVRLGSESDLAEKLKFVVKILADPEKIDEDDVGVVYASNAKRISFLREGSYKEMQKELEKEKEEQQNISSSLSPQPEQGENTQNTASDNPSSVLGTSSEN